MNPTSEPTVAPTLNPTTQQPTSCEERVTDLEARLAISTTQPPTFASTPNPTTPAPTSNPTANLCKKDLEGCLDGRKEDNDSFSETVADFEARLELGKKTHAGCLAGRKKDNDSFNETVAGFEARLASAETQCNVEVGEHAFGACRCNELSILRTNNVCKDMPVDCVDGFVRTDPTTTCNDACDGQCCVGYNNYACMGFTGYIYRDGKSCIGDFSCHNANIKVVQRSSCAGFAACQSMKSDVVRGSCNGDNVCKDSEIQGVEGSCNGEKASKEGFCRDIIATSFVDQYTV